MPRRPLRHRGGQAMLLQYYRGLLAAERGWRLLMILGSHVPLASWRRRSMLGVTVGRRSADRRANTPAPADRGGADSRGTRRDAGAPARWAEGRLATRRLIAADFANMMATPPLAAMKPAVRAYPAHCHFMLHAAITGAIWGGRNGEASVATLGGDLPDGRRARRCHDRPSTARTPASCAARRRHFMILPPCYSPLWHEISRGVAATFWPSRLSRPPRSSPASYAETTSN